MKKQTKTHRSMINLETFTRTGREVRVAIIGLGQRGLPQAKVVLNMPDVKCAIACDVYKDRVKTLLDWCTAEHKYTPDATLDWHEAVNREDIDAVFVFTSWQTHIRIACEAMKAGHYVGMEVGGASSIDECWKLVRTSEETGKPCMLLENCCYNDVEMALLNMIKQGIFGELVHCTGGYHHDLRDEIGLGDKKRHYRMDNFFGRNGELYPTHEIGPISKYLEINRGNRFLTLSSMSSKAVGLNAWLKEHRRGSGFEKHRVNEGDIVVTNIKCANGELVTLTHDCSLPRPYSRGGLVQGTKAIWQEDGKHIYIEGVSPGRKPGDWAEPWDDATKYIPAKYEHPLWKYYREFGKRGGHGGMDYLVLRGFIEAVQKNEQTPIDVYDTATWMAITVLSESSVALGGMPLPFPDFTDGMWVKREPAVKSPYALDRIP